MDLIAGSMRPMTPADVAAVAGLEAATFTDPWPPEVFFDELRAPGRHYLLIESEGSTIGYAGIMIAGEDAHLMTVAVEPPHRRSGVATRLMLEMVERAIKEGARNMTLEVRPSNQPAHQLYEKFGFVEVGVRPGYYRDEDAVVMWALDLRSDQYAARLATIRDEL